ncbi:hypothetical protein Barb6XT_02980 [Bacteroidales bacterium Barb6XT]|nr:hypothetical protein Barb6XT_02980 [Bacteroidales bacterium Barb6XT]
MCCVKNEINMRFSHILFAKIAYTCIFAPTKPHPDTNRNSRTLPKGAFDVWRHKYTIVHYCMTSTAVDISGRVFSKKVGCTWQFYRKHIGCLF